MPYVNIQITKGATRAQKARLVREVTGSLVRILGKKPEHTHIVIQEIAEGDWGFSGLLTDDWKKRQRTREGAPSAGHGKEHSRKRSVWGSRARQRGATE
ncbi:MAG: 4-oxalocrotonate tautomerase family protein [Nitrospira sp.]|nr:4-oxalocrotonate tautomerase family protein [Nitrospira sp.]